MSYKSSPEEHGRAEYGSYMQMVNEAYDNITQGDDNPNILENKYARLVYVINNNSVISTDKQYSQIVRTSGDFDYIMEKELTTSGDSSNSIWRIKQIENISDNEFNVKWAEGNDNFDKIADDYLTYTYTY